MLFHVFLLVLSIPAAVSMEEYKWVLGQASKANAEEDASPHARLWLGAAQLRVRRDPATDLCKKEKPMRSTPHREI